MSDPKAGHLYSLQSLRALAAIAVAIAHLPRLHPATPLADYGAVGVDLFFVISGFIMVYTTAGSFGRPGAPLVFLAKRIARIVPTYWIATAAAAALWFQIGLQQLVTPA